MRISNSISQNRFAIQQEERDKPNNPVKTSEPSPICLREQTSNELIKNLISMIGENSFYVISINREIICKTKTEVGNQGDYRKVVVKFESIRRKF